MEQYRLSWKLDKQRDEFLSVHKDYDKEFFTKMEGFRKKESKLRNQVKEELSYWKNCGIEYCKSTFEGLIHIATVPGLVQLFANKYGDINSEILHFGQLQTRYHIKLLDAVHLMQAQSSQMDWFITEDQKLIKKANRVPWLIFKVSTIEDFLEQLPDLREYLK